MGKIPIQTGGGYCGFADGITQTDCVSKTVCRTDIGSYLITIGYIGTDRNTGSDRDAGADIDA